jgi:hypothetical protein
MSANALSFSNQKLVADFCDSEFAPRSRGFLVPYAAHVVYIARMSRSTRLTAAFLSEKFGRKFSRRPVEDILAKVKKGDIVVTAEQLAAVASEHPSAQHHAELYPDILNPTSKMEIEDAPTPAAKKAAATKRDAKKSGKVGKAAGKPEVTTKPVTEVKPIPPPVEEEPNGKFTPRPEGSTGLRQNCTNEELEEQRLLIAESKRALGRE